MRRAGMIIIPANEDATGWCLDEWDQQAATGLGSPRLWDGAFQIKEGSWTDREAGCRCGSRLVVPIALATTG